MPLKQNRLMLKPLKLSLNQKDSKFTSQEEEIAIQDLEVETTQDLTEIEADQEIGLEVEKETTEEPHHHIPNK